MIHYDAAAQNVLSTLEKFGYRSCTLEVSRQCYTLLKSYLEKENFSVFCSEAARAWYDKETTSKTNKDIFLKAIERIEDVYSNGHVLGKHLKIFRSMTESLASTCSKYLKEIENKSYSEQHKANIDIAITKFCKFATIQGYNSVNVFSYELLSDFDNYLRECSSSFHITEGLVTGFLAFLSNQGMISPGFSLFMHYVQWNKDRLLTFKDLPENTKAVIESYRQESLDFPALEVYESIGPFVESLKNKGYGETMIYSAEFTLKMLYLFLDQEGLGYSRQIVEQWFDTAGKRLFLDHSYLEKRRILEMYDDYTVIGDIIPQKRWKHFDTAYDLLPEWCKHELSAFIKTKEKEQWDASTISMFRYANIRFCKFLASQGLTSFSEVTVQVIKDFNLQDEHNTPAGKMAYNCRIRAFLEYLEIECIVPFGIHFALPRTIMTEEHIVKILDDKSLLAFDAYRKSAITPLQVRDVAIIYCALDLGLRGCDIMNLKLTDIKWKDKMVRIVQDKTDVEHWSVMMNCTGNALYRYIKEFRPKIKGDEHVFLNIKAPHGHLTTTCCREALIRAGFNTTKFHTLRRTFGSQTLNGGATLQETAEALGQTDTGSVHKYTVLNEDKMLLCPLSLEDFGIPMDGRYSHA